MKIARILEDTRPCFSFEFFPPKTPEGEANLEKALQELREDAPEFVSVTYGALGSTRERTIDITKHIKQDLGMEAMAHFTCVGATVDQLRATLGEMREAGIENVLALRGDPPEGQAEWAKTEGGLEYSTELANLISTEFDFSIGAACFPETHPEAESPESDIRFTHAKQENGVEFLITQLFFDNDLYFDFVKRARDGGIDVPIIPGIMPVTNFNSIKRITGLCGATIPAELERELEQRKDDQDALVELGVAYATLQCADLLARGAPGIHFYTLNKSPATRAIVAALRSARPWDRVEASV